MTKAIQHILTPIFILLTIRPAQAQSMGNNSADQIAHQKIKKETGYYLHPPHDTHYPDSKCLMWIKEFDQQGRIIKYTDHWLCGDLYCINENEYDTNGNGINSWVSYQSNDFVRTKMIHKYDDQGRLIERTPPTFIRGFPIREVRHYNSQNQLIKIESWKQKDGPEYVHWSKEWDGNTDYNTDSNYKVYTEEGDLRWTVIREFEYYK